MSKNIMYPMYLSEQTIQPLLKQIPRNELKVIAAELGTDIQMFSLKSALTSNDKKQVLLAQAFAVATYLEKYRPDQIGTVDAPRKYVRGSLSMFSHMLYSRKEKTDFAYFGGATAQSIVGLAGLGSGTCVKTQTEIENRNGSRLTSTLPFLLEILASEMEIHSTRSYMDDPALNLALAFYSMRALHENGHPSVTYSFFASVKVDSAFVKPDLRPSRHVLLATPLYMINTRKA